MTVRADGFPAAGAAASRRVRQVSFTDGGCKTVELDIGGLQGFPLEFSVSVSRTHRTETDPRPLGVALYPLEFE